MFEFDIDSEYGDDDVSFRFYEQEAWHRGRKHLTDTTKVKAHSKTKLNSEYEPLH